MMDNSGAVSTIRRLIGAYKRNPDAYSDEEVAQLRQYAEAINEPFDVDFSLLRAGGNALWSAADTATFGLLDLLAPESVQPKALNDYDDAARFIGGLLGFAVPYSVGGKAAKWAMGGIKEAATAEKGAQFFQNLASKGAGAAERFGANAGTKTGGIWDDLTSQWKNVRGAGKAADDAAAAANAGADSLAGKAADKAANILSGEGIRRAAEYGDAALTGLARVANRTGLQNITEKALQFGTASALDQGFEDPMNAPGRFIGGAITGGIGAGLGTMASKVMGGEGAIGRTIRKLSGELIKQGFSPGRANALAYAYYMAQLKNSGRFEQYEPLY